MNINMMAATRTTWRRNQLETLLPQKLQDKSEVCGQTQTQKEIMATKGGLDGPNLTGDQLQKSIRHN